MNKAARSRKSATALYMELLERAVAALKSGKQADLERADELPVRRWNCTCRP